MKYKKRIFWENKENAINESKKYSSRTEFCKKSFGAYTVSKKNGWLDEMTWLNKCNVYKDPVDVVYRYYFPSKNAIYVGRTIYPSLRDMQHRKRENDTVFKFSKENSVNIPEMEVIESGLTVTEGAEKEIKWEKHYRDNGFLLINKQPCGSVGNMAKGKWSKSKCFEEAKKYKTRSKFQKGSSQAFHISMKNGWLDEMTWLPKKEFYKKGYWNNKENIIKEAKKYKTITEFQKKCGSAFNAARKYNLLDSFDWFLKKERIPTGYWKNKDLLFKEAKKYITKKEFKENNQSAYWAAFRYGFLREMTWFKDGRKK